MADRFAGLDDSKDMNGNPLKDKIFIGGLAKETTESEIRDVFKQYAPVIRVEMVTDRILKSRSGEFHRYAFVQFATEKEAARVLQLVKDRPLILREKRITVRSAFRKPKTFQMEFSPRPAPVMPQPIDPSASQFGLSSSPMMNASNPTSYGQAPYGFAAPSQMPVFAPFTPQNPFLMPGPVMFPGFWPNSYGMSSYPMFPTSYPGFSGMNGSSATDFRAADVPSRNSAGTAESDESQFGFDGVDEHNAGHMNSVASLQRLDDYDDASNDENMFPMFQTQRKELGSPYRGKQQTNSIRPPQRLY